jgi:Spy/CpxP family protein refolding chaperone
MRGKAMKGNTTNQIRSLAMGSLLLFALTAVAQQPAVAPNGVPTVEAQMKLFSDHLELTADQQARVKPILEELHDGTVRLVEDQNLSRDQRLEQVQPLRLNADRKIREVLTGDQKRKLDQLEQEPHAELHGDLHG